MKWHEKIIAVHRAVTDQVSHGGRMMSERYFVWMEDGRNDFIVGNRHGEKVVTGTTDLFTKQEFDPWAEELEAAFNAHPDISWELNSVQYEEKTGFWHHEWVWSVK